jgi:Tol biopolymer transport system component
MNKDFTNQLPEEERAMARKLTAVAEEQQLSAAFQTRLEEQLIQAHRQKSSSRRVWPNSLLPALGWVMLAVVFVVFINWVVRSVLPVESPVAPAALVVEAPPDEEVPFALALQTGEICQGPLAAAQGFSVFLSEADKTVFEEIGAGEDIGELRSFVWSPDGQTLAVLGNTLGSGNIYLWNAEAAALQPLLPAGELGYLLGASWSWDGERLLVWAIDPNSRVFVFNRDGSGLTQIDLPLQAMETPQFSPDGGSLVFLGGGQDAFGLARVSLDDGSLEIISPLVENEGSFAWSPDGSRLAYFEKDRAAGEARLVVDSQGSSITAASFVIPSASGAFIPISGSLSWTPDGSALTFTYGQYASDLTLYRVQADGSGVTDMTGPVIAPAISRDGRCLAYLSGKQVFLLDLAADDPGAQPLLMVELPPGRRTANNRQMQLGWGEPAGPAH